jgi:mono/diheme cytochrome c family protein
LTIRKLLVPAVLAAVAFGSAGCGAVGRVTSGDPSAGKQLFTQNCGACHTLADAGTTGTVGPNLDDAFSSDKQQGFHDQTIKDVIRGQIAYPEKPMPANLVSGQQADDVATYVAQCAGNAHCGVTAAKPGGGAAASPTPAPTTTSAPAGGGGASASAAGKKVFASAGCATCHTLKDAGSTGMIGPNLDQLKPSKAAVQKQVTNGGGAMPAFKGQLSTQQIDDVATYVSSVAGK